MISFTGPMRELQGLEAAEEALNKSISPIQISGCIDAAKPHMIHAINNGKGNRIVVTFHEQR